MKLPWTHGGVAINIWSHCSHVWLSYRTTFTWLPTVRSYRQNVLRNIHVQTRYTFWTNLSFLVYIFKYCFRYINKKYQPCVFFHSSRHKLASVISDCPGTQRGLHSRDQYAGIWDTFHTVCMHWYTDIRMGREFALPLRVWTLLR